MKTKKFKVAGKKYCEWKGRVCPHIRLNECIFCGYEDVCIEYKGAIPDRKRLPQCHKDNPDGILI